MIEPLSPWERGWGEGIRPHPSQASRNKYQTDAPSSPPHSWSRHPPAGQRVVDRRDFAGGGRNLLDPRPPLRPSDGPRLRTEQRADRIDFLSGHDLSRSRL